MMTQGMDSYCNYGNYCCHSNISDELVHTLPLITRDGVTVNMEMSLMNQSEDDDHSGGEEETRGSILCCVVLLMIVVMVIIGCHSDEMLPKKH